MYRVNKADEKLKDKIKKTSSQLEKMDNKAINNDKLTTNNNGGIHIISYAYNIGEKEQSTNGNCSNKIINNADNDVNNVILNKDKKDDIGVTNHGFINNDENISNNTTTVYDSNQEKVFHEAVEIVKDLPALYLEHCKL